MKDFTKYLNRHPLIWITLFLFSCLSHGTMLLSTTSGIDVDAAVNGTAKNGLDLGRQGFFLLHFLLGNGWFNVYYAGALTLFFLTVSCALWSYFYVQASGRENTLAILASGMLFLPASTLTMHLFFKQQAMEMAFGFCLMAITLIILMHVLVSQSGAKKNISLFLLLFPCVILFSTYQIFYVIFIYGVVAFLFLSFHNPIFLDRTTESKRWNIAISCFIFFLVGFIINQIITSFIATAEGYLTGQILWGSEPASIIIPRIIKSIGGCLIGYRPYFTWTLLVFYLLILITGIRAVLHIEHISSKVLLTLVVIGLLISPFALTILMGQAPALRAQLVYPLFLGFSGFYVFTYFEKKRVFHIVLQLCVILCLFSQFSSTQRLNYTNAMRYEKDSQLATLIHSEIDALNLDDYPIAFYGRKETALNNACMIVSEPISTSVFDWDWVLEPKYYYSSVRIVDFLNSQGCTYQAADEVYFDEFVPSVAADMPCFPADGSIIEKDGIIIVKLNNEEFEPNE